MAISEWRRAGPWKAWCKKCGEERIVTKVEDARGVQYYCGVCSNVWMHEPAGFVRDVSGLHVKVD